MPYQCMLLLLEKVHTSVSYTHLYTLPMGHVTLPTGHIVACDPLTHLAAVDNKTYIRTVEPGTYPIEIKVAELDTDYYRYVLTRVLFKNTCLLYTS